MLSFLVSISIGVGYACRSMEREREREKERKGEEKSEKLIFKLGKIYATPIRGHMGKPLLPVSIPVLLLCTSSLTQKTCLGILNYITIY